jgi:hypothetical protein
LVDHYRRLGPLESVAVLALDVGFREAYNTGILQVWYHLIDIHFSILHVKFEDRLSISLLKNKATRTKNVELEIVKFLKRVKGVKPTRPFSKLRFFPTLVCLCRLGAPVLVRTIFNKVKSWRCVQVGFLLTELGYAEAICPSGWQRTCHEVTNLV